MYVCMYKVNVYKNFVWSGPRYHKNSQVVGKIKNWKIAATLVIASDCLRIYGSGY